MAAILDLVSNMTFSADEVRDLNSLFMEAVLDAPALNQYHTFHNGIRNDREIGVAPATLGLLLKAAQGCEPTAQTATMTVTQKKWELKRMEMLLKQCYTDLNSSFLTLIRNLGVNVGDLTTTEYFTYLTQMVGRDLPKEILRHAWFGNTAAADVDASPAGVLTSGTDEDYWNIITGFFPQLAVIYAADTDRKTTIAANAEATYALQKSVLTAESAFTALNSVVDDAPTLLKTQPDRIILCTQSVYDKAKRYLQSIKMVYDINTITGGLSFMNWDDWPLYPVPLWDQWIMAYEDNGTKYNSPHRIVATTKSNLNIGMEGNGLFETVNTWYDKTTKYNYIDVIDSFDAKIIMDDLVQVGI